MIAILAVTVLLLNVLDSFTTHLAFKQYPDKELRGEGNPVLRWLMLRNKWLAETVKQGVVLAVVVALLLANDIVTMRLAAILLGFVVLNNTYVIVSRAVTRRKVRSPLRLLQEAFHMPDAFTFYVGCAVIVVLAYSINYVVW